MMQPEASSLYFGFAGAGLQLNFICLTIACQTIAYTTLGVARV